MSLTFAPTLVGPGLHGMRMLPEEFDAIEDWEEGYVYELVHGVLVVAPEPLEAERGPNELLVHWLRSYHPQKVRRWIARCPSSEFVPRRTVVERTV